MKKIIYIFALSFFILSCDKNNTIGYLVTEGAGYSEDYMMVRIELDDSEIVYIPLVNEIWKRDIKPTGQFKDIHQWVAQMTDPEQYYLSDAGIDFIRKSFNLPWETSPIEGIRGTKPIKIYVNSATTSDGDEQDMIKYLKVRGDGTILLPLTHKVPAGTYLISLRVENEGHTKIISDCYTFEVVQKLIVEEVE